MAKILWLNWSGGGNLPPSLGIARVLTERGHGIAFAGRPEMVPRVENAGFQAIELTRAYEQFDRYPNKWIPKAASYATSPAMAEQIDVVVTGQNPDLLVIDAMFPVALIAAARFSGPTVVMCHTAIHRMADAWRKQMSMVVGLRTEAGFPPLSDDLDVLWMTKDRVLVTTLLALDQAQSRFADSERIRHVGPVLEMERHSTPLALPWRADDPRPLVLVSFSTMPEQGSAPKFQNAVDALAALPVRAVVTVGESVDPALVKPAENVLVVGSADHEDLMRRASLVVTHGGHGTFMRALKHGLPLVVIPGMAHDQAPNAATAQALGVGIALPGDANAAAMRSAIETVLAAPTYRAKAQSISRAWTTTDGASNAADEIEQLLAERRKTAA